MLIFFLKFSNLRISFFTTFFFYFKSDLLQNGAANNNIYAYAYLPSHPRQGDWVQRINASYNGYPPVARPCRVSVSCD